MKKNNFIKVTLIIVGLILIRLIFFDIKSPDYNIFLKGWFEEIIANGKINSLEIQIGNYTPPYFYFLTLGTYITTNSLFWIKLVSCIFDFIMAFYVYLIVKEFDVRSSLKPFIYALLIPGVLFNSALIGQCDVIYTSFVLMFVYYIIKDRNKTALTLLGVALSFKLQAIFIFPIIIYLLFCKKVKIYELLFIIFGFVIMMIPANIYGKDLFDVLNVYFGQTTYKDIVRSAPNLYSLSGHNYEIIPMKLKYILSILTIIISYIVTVKDINSNEIFNKKIFINKLTILSILVPFILPGMMDRYFYMANIFILILYFIDNDKNLIKVFILSSIAYVIPLFGLNFISVNPIMARFSERFLVSFVSSTINLGCLVYLLYKYLWSINKNKLGVDTNE